MGALIFLDIIFLLRLLVRLLLCCCITPKTVHVSAANASRGKFRGLGIVFKEGGGLLFISGSICEGSIHRQGPAPPFGFENLYGGCTNDNKGFFEKLNGNLNVIQCEDLPYWLQ